MTSSEDHRGVIAGCTVPPTPALDDPPHAGGTGALCAQSTTTMGGLDAEVSSSLGGGGAL